MLDIDAGAAAYSGRERLGSELVLGCGRRAKDRDGMLASWSIRLFDWSGRVELLVSQTSTTAAIHNGTLDPVRTAGDVAGRGLRGV